MLKVFSMFSLRIKEPARPFILLYKCMDQPAEYRLIFAFAAFVLTVINNLDFVYTGHW